MSLLRSIEENIARLVEGTFGKVFRTSVQPVELARRLVKEMDEHQQRTVRNVYVPNRYDVYLSRDDHKQLTPFAAALTSELSEYLAEHARRNTYALLTRPRVHLHLDRDLAVGRFGISVKMEQTDQLDAEVAADRAEAARSGHTSVAQVVPSAAAPAAAMPVSPITPDAFEGPSPAAAIAASEALGEGAAAHAAPVRSGAFGVYGAGEPFRLAGDVTRVKVGRGRANDIVLSDASVSREHGEFVHRDGSWFVRDLDSTNGVSVNGRATPEAQLAPGDRVLFGSAEVRFDRWADGQE
ncbi:MAG: hypothetical protein JWN41_447 [Thermoleophilia bacterium]|nr:hypothetical protein [Thermoleophilia bacterium]